MRFSTRAIHLGSEPAAHHHPSSMPIFQASTFIWEEFENEPDPMYTRYGNPTRYALEDVLASLEGGNAAICTSSGMGAVATAFSLVKAGDHVVCTRDVYGGTANYLKRVLASLGVEHTFCDMTDVANLEASLRTNTKLVWLETPSNPTLKITDIASCAARAKNSGAIVGIDNTFASPCFQNPLSLGADIVMHSTTKYINGHHDAVGGVLIWNDELLTEPFHGFTKVAGNTPGPFDCWLALRGVRTLEIRMKRQAETAMKLAVWLQEHKKVRKVYYPGLPSHPGHEMAKKQMSGFSGMVSFDLGSESGAAQVLDRTRLFRFAASLGGVTSLISYPAKMSHAMMPEEMRNEMGATLGLLRVSVGLEDADDLIEDLDQALAEA